MMFMHKFNVWNDERNVELLRKMYLEKKTASQIAAALGGISRNAVIGKINRLGLTRPGSVRRAKPLQERKRRKNRANWNPFNGQPVAPTELGVPLAGPNIDHQCTLIDLTDASCRFPVWEEDTLVAERFYCGVPEANMKDKKPYCKFHATIAYNGASANE